MNNNFNYNLKEQFLKNKAIVLLWGLAFFLFVILDVTTTYYGTQYLGLFEKNILILMTGLQNNFFGFLIFKFFFFILLIGLTLLLQYFLQMARLSRLKTSSLYLSPVIISIYYGYYLANNVYLIIQASF